MHRASLHLSSRGNGCWSLSRRSALTLALPPETASALSASASAAVLAPRARLAAFPTSAATTTSSVLAARSVTATPAAVAAASLSFDGSRRAWNHFASGLARCDGGERRVSVPAVPPLRLAVGSASASAERSSLIALRSASRESTGPA